MGLGLWAFKFLTLAFGYWLLAVVRSLFAKTKRAFANAKAGRTLVCLFLAPFVPPFRGLEGYSMPQILTVLSVEPLIIFVPSGFQQTEVTRFECPLKVRIHTPLFASHILMVESTEPLAK